MQGTYLMNVYSVVNVQRKVFALHHYTARFWAKNEPPFRKKFQIFSGNKKCPLSIVSGHHESTYYIGESPKKAKKEDPTSFETHRVLIDISC